MIRPIPWRNKEFATLDNKNRFKIQAKIIPDQRFKLLSFAPCKTHDFNHRTSLGKILSICSYTQDQKDRKIS